MALVVEDGTGLANAESYNSLAEIDTYLAATATLDAARAALKTTWDGAADAAKEAAAREATTDLDGEYLDLWPGLKDSKDQALAWPRSSAVDAYGYSIASNVIPQALKDAHAELSLRALTANLVKDEAAGSGSLTAKTIKAETITVHKEWGGRAASEQTQFTGVDKILRPLLGGSTGSNTVELRRA